MQNKFFEVTAKCGHVGRHQYYEGVFYEKATDASTAAAIVRYRPRVKHDHKDAILWVREITESEYQKGKTEQQSNPYFLCGSRWQQRLVWNEIEPFLRPEQEKVNQKSKHKRPYKRERFAMLRDVDYAFAV